MMLQKNAKTGEVELIKIDPPLEEEEFTDVVPEPTLEERLESIKTQNELALAELAEVILGGML